MKYILFLSLLVLAVAGKGQQRYPEASTGLMPDGGTRTIHYSFDTTRVFLLCADTTRADDLAAVNNHAWWLKAYRVVITEHWLYQKDGKLSRTDIQQKPYFLDWYKEPLAKKYCIWQIGFYDEKPGTRLDSALHRLDSLEKCCMIHPGAQPVQNSHGTWLQFVPVNFIQDFFGIDSAASPKTIIVPPAKNQKSDKKDKP